MFILKGNNVAFNWGDVIPVPVPADHGRQVNTITPEVAWDYFQNRSLNLKLLGGGNLRAGGDTLESLPHIRLH